MQADDATQTAASMPPTPRRLLVLVGGPFPGSQDDRAGLILARARGAEVLVVAPALPIPGERWTVDLDARKAQARAFEAGPTPSPTRRSVSMERSETRAPVSPSPTPSTASPPTSTSTA
jgi:hypothetical protein